MVLRATASTLIPATPQQVMELVLDLERYRQVDSKIVAVSKVAGPDESGKGRVRGCSTRRALLGVATKPQPSKTVFPIQAARVPNSQLNRHPVQVTASCVQPR